MSQSALKRASFKQWNTAWMLLLVAIMAAFFSTPLLAQQAGEIAGQVTDGADGSAISGVTVEATSPVLPGMRTSTSSGNGDYRLPSSTLQAHNSIRKHKAHTNKCTTRKIN